MRTEYITSRLCRYLVNNRVCSNLGCDAAITFKVGKRAENLKMCMFTGSNV